MQLSEMQTRVEALQASQAAMEAVKQNLQAEVKRLQTGGVSSSKKNTEVRLQADLCVVNRSMKLLHW